MDRTITPTNLLSWPKIKILVPEYKLIIQSLWQNPSVRASGCYFLDMDIFAAYLGFSVQVVEQAVLDLELKDLVVFDNETSEIFICDWWRFHKCANAVQEKMVQNSVDKIQSKKIRNAFFSKIIHVSYKIIDLHPNNNDNANNNFNNNDNYDKKPASSDAGLDPAQQDVSGGDSIFKFPKALDVELRLDVQYLIMNCNNSALILDELGAGLEAGQIKNPVAWVRKVANGKLDRTPAGLRKTQQRLA